MRTILYWCSQTTAAPEICTLSLHDALPIWPQRIAPRHRAVAASQRRRHRHESRRHARHERKGAEGFFPQAHLRSEEHTSELQSRLHLVCRLLLEKTKSYRLWQIDE